MGKIILIAAVANDNVIGYQGKMPWVDDPEFSMRIREDMERFVRLTANHGVIMGRKTYESIGTPLKNRLNVVVSRTLNHSDKSDVIYRLNLETAIEEARKFREDGEVYVIGGEEIYRSSIEIADRLEITHIHRNYTGDSFFPKIDLNVWQKVAEGHRAEYEFVTYERK
ncbi:MAG: dihydrofolate reductase [Nanoarchaeota archaeon]